MTGKKPNPKALLRTRWRELFSAGCMSRLRSEGRLVALYVFYVADWTTCEVKVPLRRAARFMRVYPNTIRRGLEQMIAEGIIEKIAKTGESGKTRYRVLGGSRVVTGGVTSGDPPRSRAVTSAHTHCDQRAHSVCAHGSPLVTSAHTGCDPNSVSFSGSSVRRTSESTSTADAGAGLRPARRRRPSRLIEMPPPPAGVDTRESPAFDPGDTMTPGDDS